ncbi:AMP-binding protein [Mycolicibacterium fluoranthenivorans]|uniref:Long-chain-fatty-acid--CoA ligase FadD13 n=1 Tax=Mycolicibacterium fluoranthenivorans TaxID=258505 RepID=A0A7G8PND1_9MYCO|nr:AMP-binding protein [Mycolicibacterium fluoranthenivorans]
MLLDQFRDWAATASEAAALIYFDTVLSVAALDAATDALAAGLQADGLWPGDRVALYLQNMPQYVIALLATWKAGGIAVAINPMLTPAEVAKLLADSTPRVVIALDELCTDECMGVFTAASVGLVVSTSPLDWADAVDPRVLDGRCRTVPDGAVDLGDYLRQWAGHSPELVVLEADATAVITYTSGTTGVPKGALNTHRNIAFGARTYVRSFELGCGDIVLGVAPLFHVTGLSGHIACAMSARAPLMLCYRFHAGMVVDLIRRHGVTFTVGALTVFIALTEALIETESHGDRRLPTLTKVASGGAPVAPAVVDRFETAFGPYIRNVYGMTETTAPVFVVPNLSRAPQEQRTGALSVGKAVEGVEARVLDDHGHAVPPGVVGEIALRGPQIVPGYWRNPGATTEVWSDGWLLTGDVGYVDDHGWFFLVDRKKDVIIAAGYKVWPREVEDVLYAHEAVLEAAVIGRPDLYRGETVTAFVSFRAGIMVEPEDLVSFCRQRLAAYKCPRQIEVVESIPKTATGKVMRRILRNDPASR